MCGPINWIYRTYCLARLLEILEVLSRHSRLMRSVAAGADNR